MKNVVENKCRIANPTVCKELKVMENLPIIKTEKKLSSILFYIFTLFFGGLLFATGSYFSYKETMIFQSCFLGFFALGSFVFLFPTIFVLADEISVFDDYVEIKTFYGKSKKKILIKDIEQFKSKPRQNETVFYHSKGKFKVYHFFNDMNCFKIIAVIVRLMKKTQQNKSINH